MSASGPYKYRATCTVCGAVSEWLNARFSANAECEIHEKMGGCAGTVTVEKAEPEPDVHTSARRAE